MANENDFNKTVGSLFNGMDGLLTTKTVVGEPTHIGDTIILPLVDVNFAVAAGAFANDGNKNSAGGGMGGKMSPTAVLVIQNGYAKMVTVNSGDAVSKIIDMVPEVIDKVVGCIGKGKESDDEGIADAIRDVDEEEM